MESRDFKKCCQAVEEGEEIYLEKLPGHEHGRLLYCTGDAFQVKVEDHRELWSPGTVEEAGSSSEAPERRG